VSLLWKLWRRVGCIRRGYHNEAATGDALSMRWFVCVECGNERPERW
jgi:hypothetical protein